MSVTEEHYSYGKVYFDQGDFARAVEEFKLALECEPGNGNVLIGLGRCHFEHGEYEEAESCFERALKAAPQFADAHYYLGRAYLEREQRDKAINEFKEALNTNPRYKAAKLALNRLLQMVSKDDKRNAGPDKHEEEEERISRQANIHFHMGNALMQKKLLQESLVELKESARLRPNYPDTRNRLGELYMQRGLYRLAEEEFRIALKINPRYVTSMLNLAGSHLQHVEQLMVQAQEMYEQVREIDSENQQAKEGLEKVKAVKEFNFV